MIVKPSLLAIATMLSLQLLSSAANSADEPKAADAAKVPPSRVVAVTVYQKTALITRETAAPDAAGISEVIISPLPPTCMQSSLYAEASDGIRVLSARFRVRAIYEDTREEVRKLETKIKETQNKIAALQADLKAAEANTLFLGKLEGFTAATMTQLTEKGHLDSEKTIALATFIKESRVKQTKGEVEVKQQTAALQEELAFHQRQLAERSGSQVRTERDAVVMIDKSKAGPGTVRLNYFSTEASWRPQYKLRAGAKDADRVAVEYQASITQQTGEDWGAVDVTLSTAQPLLNAAPPELKVLEVAIAAPGIGQPNAGAKPNASPDAYLSDLKKQSQSLRRQSADNSLNLRTEAAGKDANDAAALEQYRDLLAGKEELDRMVGATDDPLDGGPSVTYHLKSKLTMPTRAEEQVIEIVKLDLAPKFYYKAVPVLTSHVYRIADLVNTTEYVLLPGEATMYLSTDFVGRMTLPLVAIGRPFSVGFGVDPQLQVQRKLIDKKRITQGGNQVLTFNYRVLLSSYKTTPVDVQLWERTPHAEAQNSIVVTLQTPKTPLSEDPLYVRDEKPKNLLRWDLKLDPKQNGEKALAIDYDFKLELDRNVSIGAFLAR